MTQLLRVFTECVVLERIMADRSIPPGHHGRVVVNNHHDWVIVGLYGSMKMEYGKDQLMCQRLESLARKEIVPTSCTLIIQCRNRGLQVHIFVSPFKNHFGIEDRIREYFVPLVSGIDLDMPDSDHGGWSPTDIYNGAHMSGSRLYVTLRTFDTHTGTEVGFALINSIWGLKFELVSHLSRIKTEYLENVPQDEREFDWNRFLYDLGEDIETYV